MSRIFFAYFFFFQLFFLLSLRCWFISYLNLRFCFLEQANRELVQTLCAIWCMVFCQEYNLKHDSQKKKHYRSKSSESCFAGILQNSFPNSLFKELASKHYGLDRKFSRNSMAKPSIRRFCNVQPSDRAGSTRHSGSRSDWAGSTRHSGSRADRTGRARHSGSRVWEPVWLSRQQRRQAIRQAARVSAQSLNLY